MEDNLSKASPTDTARVRSIAFFDFDGTISDRDSFIDFIIFYHGKFTAYLGLFRLLPILLAYKIKLVPNWKAKESVLRYFFKDEPLDEFQQYCDRYSLERIPQISRVGALQAIQKHHELGNDVYLVSASPENWLSAWCNHKGLKLIGSRLETKEKKLTGRLVGKNCYGPEKVARIHQEVILNNYQDIYCYGDSSGDRELLQLADHAYFRPFR
ncbi:MAG: HAD-IB family hydrolase [Bacteroidota bacterium]